MPWAIPLFGKKPLKCADLTVSIEVLNYRLGFVNLQFIVYRLLKLALMCGLSGTRTPSPYAMKRRIGLPYPVFFERDAGSAPTYAQWKCAVMLLY